MKIIQYSVFRALCAIAVGALLVKYREDMVEWMTIAIGVLFFLSGLAAMIASMTKKKVVEEELQTSDSTELAESVDTQTSSPNSPATERNGWGWGSFVGMGCMILGLILALMPQTFVHFLVYIISAFLIIGAIQQFVTLAVARRDASVGFFYWVMPTLLLIVGGIALFKPTTFATAPLFFIGWFLMIYGIVECINALKARSNRKKAEKEANFYNLNQRPDFTDAEVVEAEEVKE
jgi:uncharacterized membrane protein HdeD (DUF308 family)